MGIQIHGATKTYPTVSSENAELSRYVIQIYEHKISSRSLSAMPNLQIKCHLKHWLKLTTIQEANVYYMKQKQKKKYRASSSTELNFYDW